MGGRSWSHRLVGQSDTCAAATNAAGAHTGARTWRLRGSAAEHVEQLWGPEDDDTDPDSTGLLRPLHCGAQVRCMDLVHRRLGKVLPERVLGSQEQEWPHQRSSPCSCSVSIAESCPVVSTLSYRHFFQLHVSLV